MTHAFIGTLQTGAVPGQSVESTHSTHSLALQTGTFGGQVVRFQPVWVALQTSRVVRSRQWPWPTLQVGATHWLLLQIMLEPQSLLIEQPHVPALAWQTGVVPEQVVTEFQPVWVALQI